MGRDGEHRPAGNAALRTPISQSQREILKASTDLRLAQQEMAAFYSEMFGYPTRARARRRASQRDRAAARAARAPARKPGACEERRAPSAEVRRPRKAGQTSEPEHVSHDERSTRFTSSPSRRSPKPRLSARRSRAALTLFSKLRDDDVAIATTPKDEVWRQDKVTLHHYRPLAEPEGRDPGADRLRADRPLHHGGPAGGPLARPQSPQARRRSLRRGLGKPVACRPLAHARRLHRRVSGRVRRSHLRAARYRQGQPAGHLRRRRVYHLLRGAASRDRENAWCSRSRRSTSMAIRSRIGSATASSICGRAASRRRTSIA